MDSFVKVQNFSDTFVKVHNFSETFGILHKSCLYQNQKSVLQWFDRFSTKLPEKLSKTTIA
jgi:hypothetical protein